MFWLKMHFIYSRQMKSLGTYVRPWEEAFDMNGGKSLDQRVAKLGP